MDGYIPKEKKNIFLASTSPRRREILEMLGFHLTLVPPECDEETKETEPSAIVTDLAKKKGLSVYEKTSRGILVSSDTIVFCDGKVCEKPASPEAAVEMLEFLSGKTHEVYTGVFIKWDEKEISFFDRAMVKMYDNSPELIKGYVETKEPLDKAGSYGINGRGAVLIEKITGDYYTIMGLPAARVYRAIMEL